MTELFPIHTATACQLKWTWSTIMLKSGLTNSCHRVNSTRIHHHDFDSFHNTDKKLADRQLMLEGKWPQGGCEYCKNIEDAGGYSDRQFQKTIPGLVPPELDTDLTAVRVTPRILEIYFDNVCNMSCVYCWDGFSSRIEKENKKHGRFEQDGLVIDNRLEPAEDFKQLTEQFLRWMDANVQDLRRLHVLGGEPFYQPQLDTCLEFLESRSLPDLEFNIITNLKVPLPKLAAFCDRMKTLLAKRRLKRFDITCSIDCWGPEQEYVRYGIDMQEWQRNFEYLAEQKWLTLNINQTITGLTIKSMPDLIRYVNGFDRPIGHYFMACVNRPYLYPGIFGDGFWDKDFGEILSLMPKGQAKDMMLGLGYEFQSHARDAAKIQQLKTYLDEMDRRRNLDWRKTFPWLTEV